MNLLCLICARSGSKGVPNKNIKLMANKPLIGWTIELAKKIKDINNIVVSTDSKKIADIALSFGAKVPCLRPKHLATDDSLQIHSIKHMVRYLEKKGNFFDAIILMQPTCPIRRIKDVKKSIDVFKKTNSDTLVSLKEITGGISTLYNFIDEHKIKPVLRNPTKGTIRQNEKKLLMRSGSVYIISRNIIMKNNSIYGKKITGVIFPEETNFNIDNKFDWDLTESWIIKNKKNINNE
tara:strand:+ start:169 stop:876 length:708 start_codon:yes stop_codon:yes gene_type:complete